MTKKKTIALVLAGVILISAGGLFIYNKNYSKPVVNMEMPDESFVGTVGKNTVTESVTATGSVTLYDEQEIYAEGETNIIDTFLVEEGDYVEVGQILVEYDVEDRKEELEQKITESETNLKNSKLSLDEIVREKTQEELNNLENSMIQCEKSLYEAKNSLANYETKLLSQEAKLESAKKDLEKAEKNVSDNEQLLNVGGISQQEYDNSVLELEKTKSTYNDTLSEYEEFKQDKKNLELNVTTAENDYENAQYQLSIADNPLSDSATNIKYQQQKNSYDLTQSSLKDLQKDYAELVYSTSSPVSGYVTEICVDEGTYTEENTVMLKVADFNKLIVTSSISEYDATNVKVGQKVTMTSDGLEDKVYNGTVTKVNLTASSVSTMMGTETAVPVEISVDNPDGVLKPGYTLDLDINVSESSDLVGVSIVALQKDENSEEYYIYTVDDSDIIHKTVVEVGEFGDNFVEIVSGAEEGDRFLLSPMEEVTDGMKLEEFKDIMNEKMLQGIENKKNSKEEESNDSIGGMPGGFGGQMGGMPGGSMGGGMR